MDVKAKTLKALSNISNICLKSNSSLEEFKAVYNDVFYNLEIASKYKDFVELGICTDDESIQNEIDKIKRNNYFVNESLKYKDIMTIKIIQKNKANLLDKEKKQQFDINDNELTALTNLFMKNLISSMSIYSDTYQNEKISLANYQTILFTCDDRNIRKNIYYASVNRTSNLYPKYTGKPDIFDNTEIVNKIIDLRNKQAKILGHDNYANNTLETMILNNSDKVFDFLAKYKESIKPLAIQQFEDLKTLAKKDNIEKIEVYDIFYYINKHNKVPNILVSFDNVMIVLSQLLDELFDISFTELLDKPKWDPDIRIYELKYEGSIVGTFVIDPFTRPNKNGNPRTIAIDFLTNDTMPEACIVLSLNKEQKLNLTQISTLFHEFGHTMHHLLSRCKDMPFVPFNGVEWDAIEVPSLTMEKLAHKKITIDKLLKIENINIDPVNLYDGYKNCYELLQLRQLYLSYLDMSIHTGVPVKEAIEYCNNEFSLTDPIPENNELYYFPHLFGSNYSEYAGGYYSYIYAQYYAEECINKLINNYGSKSKTKKYISEILMPGGSRAIEEGIFAFIKK